MNQNQYEYWNEERKKKLCEIIEYSKGKTYYIGKFTTDKEIERQQKLRFKAAAKYFEKPIYVIAKMYYSILNHNKYLNEVVIEDGLKITKYKAGGERPPGYSAKSKLGR